ncbi:MAG: glycoside hydrolase family 43, partial [Schumannella sp.]|nr:glycoside hydrolase family 43 [Schumannella sp.]
RIPVRDSAGILPAEAIATWDVDTGDTFTAELNLTGAGHGLLLDGDIVSLPEGFAPAALHCWRVVVDGELRVWVDGFLLIIQSHSSAPRLGVVAGPTPLRIGSVALTRTVAAAADRAAPRPVPGRFWASPGDWDLHVQRAGTYRVYADDEPIATLELAAGPSRLPVPDGPGPVLVTVTDVPDGTRTSISDVSIAGFGKQLLGDATWDDVIVDATVTVEFGTGDSHADLLLRATELAEGGEGDDTRLGIDFVLGYSVQLHPDRLVLARHAYDERVLATHPVAIDPGVPHQLHLRARGGDISVELDGRRLFDVHDPLPYPAGSVGIRTSNARLHVERLELAAGGTPPEN